ncbi:SUKH-3 domain-containing protein [Ruminococcus albus]|uniref:SUKH-3 immunity protein n=1 Tax=Ruminococcus albus TaxID=1264 RepID=A0A1H7FDX1_RUMAL|nr:SUKH-3 domain-containing protein [Ruminococcus albus]SEK24291.1 SUKH-3 immunity protein [Ruminococcus albus]
MSLVTFYDIKNDPGFRTVNGTLEHQLEDCNSRIMNESITFGDKIIELVKKYGEFYIDRIEHDSGDRLRFYFMPFFNPCKYWSEFDQKAVFIGTIVNSDCRGFLDGNTIESAYLLNDGCYYNQSKKKIADSIEELFDYFMMVEYDYHAPISPKTYERLKNGGWYEGRKVDISNLIGECEEAGITLTDKQKAFFEEFSGIICKAHDGQEVEIFSKLSHGICQVSADSDEYEEKWMYDNYDKNSIWVGMCYTGEGRIWLTGDGQLLLFAITGVLKDDAWISPIGRTIMNGFNVLLG